MSEIKLDKTQERVFRFMTDFGSITSLEAITELGETDSRPGYGNSDIRASTSIRIG